MKAGRALILAYDNTRSAIEEKEKLAQQKRLQCVINYTRGESTYTRLVFGISGGVFLDSLQLM